MTWHLCTTRHRYVGMGWALAVLLGAVACEKADNKPAKPRADFSFKTPNWESLPAKVDFQSAATDATTLRWRFGNGTTSSQPNPTATFAAGGIYSVTLIATNAGGTDSITQQVRVSPYPQAYSSNTGASLNLYAWDGAKTMILSRSNTLNRAAMFKWVTALDSTFSYYKAWAGLEPNKFPQTYIRSHVTFADVPSPSFGFLSSSGVEVNSQEFDAYYAAINGSNQYAINIFQALANNFFWYPQKLDYKTTNSPVLIGTCRFLALMAMANLGVSGPPASSSVSFATYKSNLESLVDRYTADPTATWATTLGAGQGLPNSGFSSYELLTSFCLRLARDNGGNNFVQKLFIEANRRPNTTTTQDAVDNFFLASCAAANKNLTALFTAWRWPLSSSALSTAKQYP